MRHRFHAICPYFAMFPETFVQKNLIWSKPGDLVLDPFSGRGTTVFESLLNGRQAIGCDINSVATCISNAKASPPLLEDTIRRLHEIKNNFTSISNSVEEDPFFQACYHTGTLKEILHLRASLNWKENKEDRFIAAVTLGALHGESHRSNRYLSNRMPRTISTKPLYSIRWWEKNGYFPPNRKTFNILHSLIEYRFESEPAKLKGIIAQTDVREIEKFFPEKKRKVSLVITSPPYFDTTNFEEDQWLRLWFLGGSSKPTTTNKGDDRHTQPGKYWKFIEESWVGIKPLLKKNANIIVRIGGKKLEYDEIYEGLNISFKNAFGNSIKLVNNTKSKNFKGQRHSFNSNSSSTSNECDFHYSLI